MLSSLAVKRDHSVHIHTVCIYCGSSSGITESYAAVAHDVATAIAAQKGRIVYGGGHVGLMGIVADAALKAGAEVIGIIPEHIKAKEVQHKGLTKLHVVSDMHTRKRMMVEHADAFVILPGGLGTLDETFEIITWKKLNLHNKPIIIFNHNGFWNPLLALIDNIIDEGFAAEHDSTLYQVVTDVGQMMTILGESRVPEAQPLTGQM